MNASSVRAGGAENDPGVASTSDTVQGHGEDPRAVLSERAAHELMIWGTPPYDNYVVRGVRANAWGVNLLKTI